MLFCYISCVYERDFTATDCFPPYRAFTACTGAHSVNDVGYGYFWIGILRDP